MSGCRSNLCGDHGCAAFERGRKSDSNPMPSENGMKTIVAIFILFALGSSQYHLR